MERFRVFILLALLTPALAQIPLGPEQLAQERQRVEQSALSEEEKGELLGWLDQAQQLLQQEAAAREEIAALQKSLQEAPRRLREIERLLKRPERLTRQWPKLELSRPLPELETALAKEEAALKEAERALQERERRLGELLQLASEGGKRIAELERQLEAVQKELEKAQAGPADLKERIRTLLLEAKRRWLTAELERLRLLQERLPLFTQLARSERDLLALEVAERRSRIERLREAVELARQNKMLSAARAAELALRTAEPEVKPLFEENLALWNELEQLLAEDASLKHRLETLRRAREALRQDFERLQQAVALIGTDEKLTAMLARRLQALPDPRSFQRELKILEARLRQMVVRRFELEEASARLHDLDAAVEAYLRELPQDLPSSRRAYLRLQIREALENRRQALEALRQEYTRAMSLLSELQAQLQQFREQVETDQRFLKQKLAWIPARKGLSLQDLLAPLALLLQPDLWRRLALTLASILRQDPLPPLLTLLLSSSLLAARRRLARQLTALGEATRSVRTDRFRNTLLALLDTLLLAAPLPLLLLGLGLWLRRHALLEPELAPLADGLLLAARPAILFGLLLELCRPEGLAHRHLRWLQATREQLRRHLRWFLPLSLLCAFLVGLSGSPDPTSPLALGIGRLAFLTFLVASSLLIFLLWRRGGPIMRQREAARPGRLTRAHPLWFYPALLLPLGLAGATLAGYDFIAFYLTRKLFQTLSLFLGLLLLKDLLLRWLYVTERWFRFQELLRKRSQLKEGEGQAVPVEEPEVDFGRLSEQTRRLFAIGFFTAAALGLLAIWREAIPLLSFLQQVTLPMTTVRVEGGIPKEVPLTLADLTFGLLLGLLTFLAARNLPGLLEFALLRRFPLSEGARYAWTTLTQYGIALLGLFLIFHALGLRWSEVQWLVAALSVGIGFGLQEVVANFISGLILLFERPIRVGDVVTVGEVTGRVARIRMRATTIVNWDRQELVIPNKSFITGEFINWTLSDSVNRLIVPVGIAYGSDVERALALLLEIARSHPEVLSEPAPYVVFEQFGDNSLNLSLRVYLGSMDRRMEVLTDLHREIYRRFAEAGIEIAFPQRDVHLDTKRPLEIVLRKEGDA